MKPSDAEFVEAACHGDLAAFGHLYERHYRMAVGIAFNRLSDRHLAEDAAQEAFGLACRSLATLKNGERFPQWLSAICRRVANRFARNRPEHDSLPEESAAREPSTTTTVGSAVREAIELLDATSREIVLLHYFSGLSYEEISGVLGISPQSIHGRLQRARRKLALVLDPNQP